MSFSYTDTEMKVLGNFAKINPQIKIASDKFEVVNGNRKSVVGLYDLENDKEHDAYAIYDLSQYLEVINNSGSNVGLEVGDKSVVVKNKDSGSDVQYNLVDEEYVPQVKSPEAKFSKVSPELVFHLSNDRLQAMKKMANLLKLPKMYFQTVGNDIRITCGGDDLQSTINPFTSIVPKSEVDVNELDDTTLFMKMEELLIMDGDYDVKISAKGIGQWKNRQVGVQYFIGVATAK